MVYEHKVKALPYAYNKLKGISEQVNKWHHDTHYAAYVKGRNDVEAKLETMRKSGDFSGIRGIKQLESFNASGQILHELYYDIMGGDGTVDMNLPIIKQIEKDFGSFETFKKEFIEVSKVARGWTILCYDHSDKRLHVYLVDYHDVGAIWGAIPLLPIDVWEHAYYTDQGPNRGAYIEAFMQNINWKNVDKSFKGVK